MTFSVFDLIKQLKHIMEMQAIKKKLEFKIRVNFSAETAMIFNDKNRILQVLINIVYNAIKFTFKGSITVTVQRVVKDNIHLMRFCVQDSGMGMSEQVQKRLFKI